ncbi:MAG TPA: MotA/TolQ/ExbB proton channel family protein, partial [Lacunisphaera sp.]
MNLLGNLVERGGPVMYVIILLAVLLYTQCARLLISLYLARRSIRRPDSISLEHVPLLEVRQEELAVDFRNRRVMITAMISAAPLLGLLGTVSGMARTFEGLSSSAGQRSMSDLAGGISEVLVATESGLAVAIPALAVIYFAHREIDKQQ